MGSKPIPQPDDDAPFGGDSPRSGPMPASYEEMLALGRNPYTGAPLDETGDAA